MHRYQIPTDNGTTRDPTPEEHAAINRTYRYAERAADGNTYRYHATGLPAGGDRIVNEDTMARGPTRQELSAQADQQFLAGARKLSPRFPDVATMLERRRRTRETLAARTMLGFTAAFGIAAPFAEHPGVLAGFAVASFISFVAICWCAGNRHNRTYETGPDGV